MNGTPATLNFQKMFPRGYPKSTIYEGNNTAIVKQITPSNIRGLTRLPGTYLLGQNTGSVNRNRLLKNANVNTLPDGVYLYMIEYEPSSRRYYKQFIRVESRLELGSKHFMLPTQQGDRVVLAAGELVKSDGKIFWNLRSGTFMRNFIEQGGGSTQKFKNIVLNAFTNSQATLEFNNRNLLPAIPTKLKNFIKFLEAGKGTADPYNSNNSNVPNLLNWAKNKHARRVQAGLSTPNAKRLREEPSGNTPQSKKPSNVPSSAP
jgi:hypothetical protein